MAIDVEVRGFTGSFAALNAARAARPAGIAELVNKAITVGGLVRGSPLERNRRRSAIASQVLSSVRAAGPAIVMSPLEATGLYRHTETTEKSGISFRLGMAFAAVVAGRVIGTRALKHVSVRGGGAGRRADLIGLDGLRQRHVVEAKARTYGFDGELRQYAKDQANQTAARLANGGAAPATASASLVDLSVSPVFVLLEDPPQSAKEEEPLPFDEARFLREYFSPVPDLLSVAPHETSGYQWVDEVAVGAWLPGSDVWLGLDRTAYSRYQRSQDPLVPETAQQLSEPPDDDVADGWLVSASLDGHVVVLGPRALQSGSAK